MKKSILKESILRVLAYIDTHRDSKLDLEMLSKEACVSKFHFHRIFKEYMGISIGQYIKLKRLETGMWSLIYTENKVIEIALESGYENHTAFTKAFTKEMGCSPKEFKARFDKDKKIALNKLQQKGPEFLGYQVRKATDIFYFRKLGSYFKSAIQAWNDLINDLNAQGIQIKNQIYYGIPQDEPNTIETECQRFDICVEASIEINQHKSELKAEKGQIQGGRFAVFLHEGPLETLSDSLYFIYGRWIYEHPITLRDMRQFIKYKDPFSEQTDKQRKTEIYLPIN